MGCHHFANCPYFPQFANHISLKYSIPSALSVKIAAAAAA
jgi:hypothetical protein